MREAIEQARLAGDKGEVPIGAVLVMNNKVIARSHNLREIDCDPTAHAEILCLRAAGAALGRWNLTGSELYVTLEPCIMCSGAIIYARVKTVYFGAYDKRFGCCGTLENFASDTRFNHRAQVFGGILQDECLAPITEFFKSRR